MADEILELQKKDLSQVANRTHVERAYIECMINKDFEKLATAGVNAVGFAKIIAREEGIDLSDWIEEYKAYLAANGAAQNDKLNVAPTAKRYVAPDKGGNFGWIILLIVALGVFVWLFGFTKYFDGLWALLKDENATQNTAITYSNATIVEETKEKLAEDFPIKLEISNVEVNTTDMNASQIEENVALLAAAIAPKADENVSNLNEQNATELMKEVAAMGESDENTGVAIFHPVKNIWVGLKDLDGKNKRSFSRRDTFDLNLTKDMLVRTGHGMFSVETPDQHYTYNERDPQIVLIKGGKIRPLSFEEYVEINQGKKEW